MLCTEDNCGPLYVRVVGNAALLPTLPSRTFLNCQSANRVG